MFEYVHALPYGKTESRSRQTAVHVAEPLDNML